MEGLIGSAAILALSLSLFVTVYLAYSRFIMTRKMFLDDPFGDKRRVHSNPVPRIGGLVIWLSGSLITLLSLLMSNVFLNSDWLLVFCISTLIFLIGLLEDLKKTLSAYFRFITISLCVVAFIASSDLAITRLDIGLIDSALVDSRWLSFAFSVIAIMGIINAVNISDGLNGLSSGLVLQALIGLGVLSLSGLSTDYQFFFITLVSSIFGFWLVNYFTGRLFLGDGGAYYLGFWLAVFSIITSETNSEVSSWAPVVINAHIIIETLFSMGRRAIRRNHFFQADFLHLHSILLMYVSRRRAEEIRGILRIDHLVSTGIIVASSSLLTFLAIVWRGDSESLQLIFWNYGLLYAGCYWYLTKSLKQLTYRNQEV